MLHRVYPNSPKYCIRIDLNDNASLKEIIRKLMDEYVEIHSIRIEEEEKEVYAVLEIKLDKRSNLNVLMYEMAIFNEVKEFITM